MSIIIGIDLGATHARAGVVEVTNGFVYARAKIETRGAEGADAVIARLAALCERVLADAQMSPADIHAVGIGAPIFNSERRVIGSLCMTIPETRFNKKTQTRLSQILMSRAGELSRALGYEPLPQAAE